MEINKESIGAMTPEQIMELANKAKLADELKLKNEQAEADKVKLVEELKEERAKKQLAEAAAEANKNLGSPDSEQKMREVLEKVLDEKMSKQSEMTRSQFEENFKASNPEFQTSNDPGGLKYDAFKKTLSKFNLSSAKTEQELNEIYTDAMRLLNRPTQSASQDNNPYAFGSTSKTSQVSVQEGDLSPKEMKLIQSANWTKEKYLKLKVSQPQFIVQLLDSVRD